MSYSAVRGASRMIRMFDSSTFGDFKAERNALQLSVFPRLAPKVPGPAV